jgi:hypothetical protein
MLRCNLAAQEAGTADVVESGGRGGAEVVQRLLLARRGGLVFEAKRCDDVRLPAPAHD